MPYLEVHKILTGRNFQERCKDVILACYYYYYYYYNTTSLLPLLRLLTLLISNAIVFFTSFHFERGLPCVNSVLESVWVGGVVILVL